MDGDTLDCSVQVLVWAGSGDISLSIEHKNSMLFSDVLQKLLDCFQVMKNDFDVNKVTSLDFEAPIFYVDLANQLTKEYKQKFGHKTIRYKVFSNFMMSTTLTSQLNNCLALWNKAVKYYSFEKFFLIDKKMFHEYLPNTDVSAYPEFTFNAHSGISIELK